VSQDAQHAKADDGGLIAERGVPVSGPVLAFGKVPDSLDIHLVDLRGDDLFILRIEHLRAETRRGRGEEGKEKDETETIHGAWDCSMAR
jgi:hypothetical protein